MQHQLVKKYTAELTRRDYSPRTIKHYTWYVEKYIRELDHNPYHLTVNHLDEYLTNTIWTSKAQQNQLINALKLFYKFCLNKTDLKLSKIERPRKSKPLPKVIDADKLVEKIDQVKNLKHRTILSIAFSVGLRVSEVINLQVDCIDSDRMQIRIEKGKGKKDRYVPLSINLLKLLREYYKEYRPSKYLFEGPTGKMYSTSSCQAIFKNHISKSFSFHSLRHSFCTNLLEKSVDITVIAKIVGHSSIKTTQIYTKVSNKVLSQVPLPI